MEPLEYLKKLEEAGFEAYIVGGYVRDFKLGITSTDIDIATSAKPDDIKNVFKMSNDCINGGIKIEDCKYHIDITTFRKERLYHNHIPRKIKYINNLKDDLKRRDFTINSICMNSKGEIVDLLNGLEDLDEKQIRVIGNIKKKFSEDPLRMLRALRFMITLGFNIENNAFLFMMKHKNLLSKISYTRRREELDKIFSSDNVVEGMEFLKAMNFISALKLDYNKTIVKTDDILGIWAQIEFDDFYPFTGIEKEKINAIRFLVKKGIITAYDIYKYGLDVALISCQILKKNSSDVKNVYNHMKIHTGEKLNIDGNEIMEITGCNERDIKKIKEDLIYLLLSGNLSNDNDALRCYIKKYWK